MVDQKIVQSASFSTRAIHAGHDPSKWPGHPVVPGIVTSSTFVQSEPGVNHGYDYSRSGNPTREVLESVLASLEKTKYALAFSSGLATTNTICMLLKSGDEIICMDDVYGGTNRLLNRCLSNFGINIKMVDCADQAVLQAAITPGKTKMVWVESPTNPLLKIVDIKTIGQLIKNIDPNIIYVVDNTFLTPYCQNPALLGADIVMHSMTKYINGHSDLVMGCLMVNDDQLYSRLLFLQNAVGSVPSPFDCYMATRGIRTLALRMDQHYRSALVIAKYLESHPKVEKVIYPALESHPSYQLFKSQCFQCSGMLSVVLKGGDVKTASQFIKNLHYFSLAESLGGYESLIELPAIMTHASVPAEQRTALGLSDSLVRISVGLEATEDLLQDIKSALDQI